MGYQALLFCPDEKTSRSVTQVLSELDFSVIPCTEPFAAVKKMMAERFDAVVVDCDNEQNGTLLFKSARNTAHNQSSLAVAVVEGQAGVAKAFRIGANLVLTKPINVEQAKGTLRVARGLLRKNEATKSATSGGNAAKPAAASTPRSAPGAATPAQGLKPASPIAPAVAAASMASPAAKAPKNFSASDTKFVSAEADEPEIELLESDEEPGVSPTTAPKTSISAVSVASPVPAKPAVAAGMSRTGSASAASSAASAPAPARDSKAPVETDAASEPRAIVQTSASAPLPAPTFTFGGAVDSGTEAGKSGSKKVLLAVAAVLLVAVGGYAAWMKFGTSSSDTPHSVAAQPAKILAPAPAAAAAPVSAAAPAAANAVPSPSPVDTSAASTAEEPAEKPSQEAASRPSEEAAGKPSLAETPAATSTSAPAHGAKPSASRQSTKPSAATPAESKTVAKAEPQPLVIKGGTAPARKPASPDAPAPSLDGIDATGSAMPMNSLIAGGSEAPAPVLQTLSVSQGVSQGLLIKRINPVYPSNALRLRVEGTVQLLATVSDKGDVSAVKVLNGDSLLVPAATEAVKQWKYKPYLLNGSPVEIQTEITVKFKLPQ